MEEIAESQKPDTTKRITATLTIDNYRYVDTESKKKAVPTGTYTSMILNDAITVLRTKH